MKRTTTGLFTALLCLSVATGGLVACGSKKSDKSAATKSKAKPAPIVEHKLDSAHAVWKGWTAQAPKNAKVMTDGVSWARLAADGKGMMDSKPGDDRGFDIVFKQNKVAMNDFTALKEGLSSREKAFKGRLKLTIVKEEADALTWTEKEGKETAHHLVVNLKVDGKSISCGSNRMIGAGNPAELARFLTACRSLKKK